LEFSFEVGFLEECFFEAVVRFDVGIGLRFRRVPGRDSGIGVRL
jgi:hypothetical protein